MKKKQIILLIIITILIILIMVINESLKSTYSNSCSLLGDFNLDGIVDKNDAKQIASYIINKNKTENLSCADINQDGLVKMNDILWIVKGKIISIFLSKTSANITVDETIKLNATINPVTAKNKNITWKSSNTNIATVDSDGNVTGKNIGNALITAETYDGKTASCNIEVTNKTVEVTEIVLSKPANFNEYYVNGEYAFNATIFPANASDKTITWKSSNTNVATIDSTGKIKTVSSGNTTITAISNNNKLDSITINVNPPYVKKDTYPFKYKDGSSELTIEKKSYISPITNKTTYYYLSHLKISDYSRLHSGINNNGYSVDDTCNKNIYKVDSKSQNDVYVGKNCGSVSIAATNANAIFAVEGDYSLNGGHSCNKIKGSIRDGEYYYADGNKKDLTQISASGIGYGYYSKKTGILGPTEDLISENAYLAVNSQEATDSFCFSVNLLVDGNIPNVTYLNSSAHRQANFIGYKGPGDIYFVVSEGAAYSDSDIPSDGVSYGLVPKDRAQILKDLGCTYAAQLDGGGSIIVWFDGIKLQSQSVITERDWLTDFIYFK